MSKALAHRAFADACTLPESRLLMALPQFIVQVLNSATCENENEYVAGPGASARTGNGVGIGRTRAEPGFDRSAVGLSFAI